MQQAPNSPQAVHVLLELYDCQHDRLTDKNFIENEMKLAAEKAGATLLGSHFHTFNPQGITGVIIIAESHLSIHTWPEFNYAAIDIFTCGETLKPQLAIERLLQAFTPKDWHKKEFLRGMLETKEITEQQ